ncbi:MAG: hypothetical protein GOVbin1230_39 [Prokaryotic dsDNA virus sp.]|nr:MAG: hypothetical protein GOVbin1230_39 [Prokaryotic dsDNA virus sp.]|tara:strand:+ start:1604 stop:3589 length:1986 start_codon:yes stop_codon:yes gene_type:complete
MSRLINIQTNFSIGELDPLVRGRVDLQQYYNALQTASNVFIQPQGGLKRRDGLKYISELPSAANPGNGVRLVPFEFSTDDSYMFALVHQRIYIFRNNALVTNINSSGNDYLAVSTLTSVMLDTIKYTQNADTIIFVHKDLAPIKIVRGGDHNLWTLSTITFKNTPVYAPTITTSNPSSTITPTGTSGSITVNAGSSIFSSSHEKQYINLTESYGRIKIVEYVSATQVKGIVEINLFNSSQVASGDWELETGYVDSWSSSKGYPVSATFHQGRLYFGGSKSQPTTFWGSVVGDFFNFNLGGGLDDESVTATIATDSLNQIVDIHSGRDLQIFTSGSEFYIPQTIDQAVTPENVLVRTATRNGTKPGVPVAGLDSGTIYIQRSGKMLNEMAFTDTEQAYNTANISLLSSHLLNNPVDMAIRRSTSTEETDRLFVVNSGDGSMSCYSILRSQNVIAPSKVTTSGEFLAVGVDVDTIYTIVKRTINSATKYFVEVFDSSLHTDSAVYVSASSTTGTAAHLPSSTVDIINDGNVEEQQTTNGSGVVTFARASASNYEMGLPFSLEVKTMPVQPKFQGSVSAKGFKKRIIEVNADVYQSKAMSVNSQLVPFRSFGEDVLDQPVQSFTGVKKVGPLLGFNDEGTITITQSVPLELNLLALDYKVSIGG